MRCSEATGRVAASQGREPLVFHRNGGARRETLRSRRSEALLKVDFQFVVELTVRGWDLYLDVNGEACAEGAAGRARCLGREGPADSVLRLELQSLDLRVFNFSCGLAALGHRIGFKIGLTEEAPPYGRFAANRGAHIEPHLLR